MCHILFAVPFVSLLLFPALPWQYALSLYAAINGPLLLLGWHLWKIQMRQPVSGREGMVGKEAVALTSLAPAGTVVWGNELWRAHSKDKVQPQEHVRIIKVDRMELEVAACSDHQESQPAATHCH